MRVHLRVAGLGIAFLALGAGLTANVQAFSLTSTDVAEGVTLSRNQVYEGYGCKGANESPAVRWTDPPAGTKSFAFTVFDPDAPTGHGWWHWIVYDIPASTGGLPRAVGKSSSLPEGAHQAMNDFDGDAFGGACPPAGDKPHRYIFTIHALKVEHLDAPAKAPPQTMESLIHAKEIGSARITARYAR